MKHYEKITQEADLYGRYRTPDHQGEAEMDFDVLEDYSIYFYKAGWIVKNLKTNFIIAETLDEQEAFEALRLYLNDKIAVNERIAESQRKRSKIAERNSLDMRYANKKVEKKEKISELSPYLKRLQARAKDQFHEWKENKICQNWKLGNEQYIEALLNH